MGLAGLPGERLSPSVGQPKFGIKSLTQFRWQTDTFHHSDRIQVCNTVSIRNGKALMPWLMGHDSAQLKIGGGAGRRAERKSGLTDTLAATLTVINQCMGQIAFGPASRRLDAHAARNPDQQLLSQ